MGLKISLIQKTANSFINKIKPKNLKYTTPLFQNTGVRFAPLKQDLAEIGEKTFEKSEVLAKYCAKKNYNFDLAIEEFKTVEKYLDKESLEKLLKLVEEDKILLMDKPRITLKKKLFTASNFNTQKTTILSRLKPLENELTGDFISPEESANILKKLLEYESKNKIPANRITTLMKMQETIMPNDFKRLMKEIELGKITNKNVDQAISLSENGISRNILYTNSLDDLNKEDIKDLANILADKGSNRNSAKAITEQGFRDKICGINTKLLPRDKQERSKILAQISQKLTQLVKVNTVPDEISRKFIKDFDNIANTFRSASKSIDDLTKAGGIQLSYSRQSLKDNIAKLVKDLPVEEQNKVYEKFGLNKVSDNVVNGLPVLSKETNLTNVEKLVNNEINKFLNGNKIILPKGFEEYQASLESITRTFPEFLYAIGSKQHGTHYHNLSEHMLKVFQENVKNPLYKELNASDRKVLGISTLLHDINKTELTVDAIHPLTSSKTANAIVQRMKNLTVTEKNRIINFVENHHWLMKISETTDEQKLKQLAPNIKELAMKFRSGNDFTMAKIFAESDLKGVNNQFFPKYGSKINSPMVDKIEQKIINIQSKGRAIFTADISMDYAKHHGGKTVQLGTGNEVTENVVVTAKNLGLNGSNVIYHAPAKDDGFVLAQSGFGYGNEGIFDLTLGRNNHSATFQKRKEFFGFRRPDMNKISVTSPKNADLGINKTYFEEQQWLLSETSFSNSVKKEYQNKIGQKLSDIDYAKLFREIQSLPNPSMIHTNEVVIKILNSKKNALAFERAIKNANNTLVATSKDAPKGIWNFSDIAASDLEVGFIGTNRNIEDISYTVRKLAQENNWPIVKFD